MGDSIPFVESTPIVPETSIDDKLASVKITERSTTGPQAHVKAQLEAAHEAYSSRNPLSLKAHQDAHAHMPGGNTRTVLHANPFPLTFASGSGATLTDVDGHTYTDFLGEFSAGIFGHSHFKIAEAVNEALSKGWNYGGHCTYEKQLAKAITERFAASGLELVRFTNSGTESNTCAIGAAIAVTGRKKILVFSDGYHGGTLVFPKAMMKGEVQCHMNLPHEFVHAPYNNITETKEVLSTLPSNSLAAILVEPVQGSGGCRPATPDFLRFLRKTADEHESVLIVDEVMASRLGVSGCCADVGIKADILTLGKYLGGGMTFGAFGGSRKIMELFDPSKSKLFHPGTYNNNVFTMAAGLAGLELYNDAEVKRLNLLGANLKRSVQGILIEQGVYPMSFPGTDVDIIEIDSLKSATKAQAKDHEDFNFELPTMFVTGQGSMVNVRFSGQNKEILQALFYHHMLTKNINIATRGYTPLHMMLTEAETRLYVEAIKDFVVTHRDALCDTA